MEENKTEAPIVKKVEEIKAEKKIYIFELKYQDYHHMTAAILKKITNLKMRGIYVTLNTSYPRIKENLEAQGIDTSELFFIDCISKLTGNASKTDSCVFVESPSSLTDMSIALTAATSSGKFDFLLIDSMNTLLLYNDIKTVEKFAHYMISKLRDLDMGGIILAVDDENSKKLLPIISQFCDD